VNNKSFICPQCRHEIKMADNARVCPSCGALIEEEIHALSKKNPGQAHKPFELGLFFSFVISLTGAFDNALLMLFFGLLGFVCTTLVYTGDEVPLVPSKFKPRFQATAARFKLFPFELYLIPLWLMSSFCTLLHNDVTKNVFLCITLFVAALMAMTAMHLYSEAKITSTQVKWLDFKTFISFMNYSGQHTQRSTAVQGEQLSKEHFSQAAATGQAKDEIRAQNLEGVNYKRSICISERKKWEDELEERYTSWLNVESSRLKEEHGDHNFSDHV